MADSRISQLSAYTTPISTDIFPIVDVTLDVTKKITLADLSTAIGTNLNAVTSSSTFGTDNILLRSDGTSRGSQSTGITVNDNNNMSWSTSTGTALALSGATTSPLISLTPTGAMGTNTATSGSFLMNYTSASGIVFQLYTNGDSSGLSYPQLLIHSENVLYNQPLLQITHKTQAGLGNSPNIRLDGGGGGPQIEWRQTTDANYHITGAGQFEQQVQGDIFFINGRNYADSGFENLVWFLRASTTDSMNGHVGIGVNPYGIEKLTIGATTGGAPRIALAETTAPTADVGYGKIYVKSSDSQLYFMDDSGTETNLVAASSGDVAGPSSSFDNAIAVYSGTTGKIIKNSTVTIGTTGAYASTIANTSNVVGFTLVQNDTTNNPRAVSITNAGTGASLFIDANGDTSTSVSVGGAILLENTGNAGAGMVIYSNHASATGRLLSIKADNTGFATQPVYIENDGSSHAVSIVQNSTGSNANGLTIVSVNPNDTTLGISGQETGKGTLKITHTYTGTADTNASAISIQLAGAGTASQGIFMDSTGVTTGKLLNLRNNGTEYLTLTAAGFLGLNTATPNSTNHVNGSFARAYRAITALRTLDATDYLIDCTSGTFTVTLPTAVGITGREYVIKNSGTGVITIGTTTAQTIDGVTTWTLPAQYDFYKVTSDGANWIITG